MISHSKGIGDKLRKVDLKLLDSGKKGEETIVLGDKEDL